MNPPVPVISYQLKSLQIKLIFFPLPITNLSRLRRLTQIKIREILLNP